MNTNHIKKFAQETRRKLLEQVGAKLNFVLTTDSAELREKTEQLKQLRQELSRTMKEQLIEKVAYTWFNRLMALRFMDVNDYQPLGIRIITPKDGYTIPELLDEAKRGNIPDELKVNRQKIYDLLDNKIPSTNPQNEAFKELLIAACNHLHKTFPFLFEKINDYTELLLPDDLTSDFSIVKDVLDGMLSDACKDVEIIGWLYQFYISEKKDEVFASKSKVKKEDIPAATQLFTPRWIVEYMVQNTLGKLWLQNRPKSILREHMPYFIESASLEAEEFLKIQSPEEIKLADPASGSGHILVYAFDLFTKIYEEEGYNTTEIPKLIIEKNLYGFEIDERASQLSALALMMKAREYQKRAFQNNLQLNIFCFNDLALSNSEIKEMLISFQIKPSEELLHDILQMQNATNFGSLIIPHSQKSEIVSIVEKLNQFALSNDIFQRRKIYHLLTACNQLLRLAEKYHCVVANPPYMGSGSMNKELSEFAKAYYPDSKSDLMACFMESGLEMILSDGFLGMINQHSWMFLSSYETLRNKLIRNYFFDTFLHLGARTFPEIGGEVVQNSAFTVWKKKCDGNGAYVRLVDYEKSDIKRSKTIEAIQNPNCGWFYMSNQKNYKKINGNPIAYWVIKTALDIFSNSPKLKSVAYPRQGLATTNNNLFLRQWFEVSKPTIGFNLNKHQAVQSKFKWFPINKGGSFRKWYGNFHFVINFENEGKTICDYIDNTPNVKVKSNGRVINRDKYFSEGLTWSTISSGSLSMRYSPVGSIFETKGGMCFCENRDLLMPILGYLNSKVVEYFLMAISPTLDFHEGPLGRLPVILDNKSTNISITEIVKESISISKNDWDSRETSWDFQQSELIRMNGQDLEESYDLFKQYWKNNFSKIHKKEEELNRQFIDIYELSDELTQYVRFEDITIQQDELDGKELTTLNKTLIRDTKTLAVTNYDDIKFPFISSEVMEQFISYSVGCMFGRYSLDKEGIILANQGENLQDYLQKISKSVKECTFLPDADNIIPVLDDEWFEDDIVGKFYHFLKVTFGEKNFNKNLAFIEEQIGKDIRKYFIKDFYPDHIKRYKKRPIYWMFSSPKGSFNVLIYLHRYTPDTVSNILNKYLKEFIGKLNTQKEHLQHVQVTGSPSEKTKAIKEIDNIDKMLVELHEYERDVLYPLATERIEIDLDDGVLVNYNKFGKAVKEVNGLNDSATKKKVKEFDWIDTSQIR